MAARGAKDGSGLDGASVPQRLMDGALGLDFRTDHSIYWEGQTRMIGLTFVGSITRVIQLYLAAGHLERGLLRNLGVRVEEKSSRMSTQFID
jgi:hypothetical protein